MGAYIGSLGDPGAKRIPSGAVHFGQRGGCRGGCCRVRHDGGRPCPLPLRFLCGLSFHPPNLPINSTPAHRPTPPSTSGGPRTLRLLPLRAVLRRRTLARIPAARWHTCGKDARCRPCFSPSWWTSFYAASDKQESRFSSEHTPTTLPSSHGRPAPRSQSYIACSTNWKDSQPGPQSAQDRVHPTLGRVSPTGQGHGHSPLPILARHTSRQQLQILGLLRRTGEGGQGLGGSGGRDAATSCSWDWSPLGTYYATTAYNVYIVSLACNKAQLDEYPPLLKQLGEQILRKAAAGPYRWAMLDDPCRLGDHYGQSADFRDLETTALAAKVYTATFENNQHGDLHIHTRSRAFQLIVETSDRLARRARWHHWIHQSPLFVLQRAAQQVTQQGFPPWTIMQSIAGQAPRPRNRQRLNRIRSCFQSTLATKLRGNTGYDAAFRMRRKLQRWHLPGQPATNAARALRRLVSLKPLRSDPPSACRGAQHPLESLDNQSPVPGPGDMRPRLLLHRERQHRTLCLLPGHRHSRTAVPPHHGAIICCPP